MTAKPPRPTPNYKRRVLDDFGPRQREFLLKAFIEGVGLDHALATPHRTRTLEEAGLIHQRTSKKGRTSWRVTDMGRGIVTGHEPRLLMPAARPRRIDSEGTCYTHIPAFAMRHEPEAA